MTDPMASPAPTGSADEYSTPIPQGASTGQADEYSSPIPTGATLGSQHSQATPPKSGAFKEIHVDPQSGSLSNLGHAVGALAQGVGEGVAGTLAGVDDMVSKIPGVGKFLTTPIGQAPTKENSDASRAYTHDIAGDNLKEHGGIQDVGRMGETVAEFMMGDAALKGLSMAEKFSNVSKFMKLAEKSPKLMNALHMGIAAGKTATELSPEEAAILKQSPKLAKLFGISLDATRAGAVQGAQTTIKTGGDVGHGAVDAAATAALTGGLGAALGGAAHVLGNGRKAAQTIEEMTQTAQHAPSPAAVEEQLGNTVHGAFDKEKGLLQKNLDDATSTVGKFGEGAPHPAAITKAAQEFATTGRQSVKAAYQKGFDELVKIAGDKTVPFEDSPLHKAAKELAKSGQTASGPLDKALNVGRPGSAKANRIVDNLADFGKKDVEGVEHIEEPHVGAAGEEPQPAALNMKHLVDYRQKLSELLRNTDGSTPEGRLDKGIYQKLLASADDTIGTLADGVGAEESVTGEETPSAGRKLFDKMNEAYRQGIQPFSNRDVRNVLNGNLNDVSKSIMGGQTSVADITAVKQAIGPKNFEQIGKSSLQNIVQKFVDQDSGELDYKKFFQNFNRISPDVREAMFGADGKNLSDALKVATKSDAGLRAIDSHIQELLGSGKIDSLLKNPQQVKAIANAVGPDGMKALGQSIVQSEIAKASTALDSKTGKIVASHFDPDKVLSWWTSMKDAPEVRDAFFTADKDTAAHYNDMMSRLAQASSVKKLVKYGVLPITLGTAGVVHGPGAALIGALAGLGTEATFGQARGILDAIANNPGTWKLLSGAGKAAEAVASSPAAKTARDVVSAKTVEAITSDK